MSKPRDITAFAREFESSGKTLDVLVCIQSIFNSTVFFLDKI